MSFSPLYSSNCGGLSQWSPDGEYVAIPEANKVYIRNSNILCVTYCCAGKIEILKWSPDSSMLLTSSRSSPDALPLVELWKLDDSNWRGAIEPGSAGLSKVIWSSDSRHIITVDDFCSSLCIWSLVRMSIEATVKNPSADCKDCVRFNSDGSYMAVASKGLSNKPTLSIFETNDWTVIMTIEVCLLAITDFKWGSGNSSTVIALYDCSSLENSLVIYSIFGVVQRKIIYSNYSRVKEVLWSHCGSNLIINVDDAIDIYRYITWERVASLSVESVIHSDEIKVYRPERETGTYVEEDSRPLELRSKPSREKTDTFCLLSSDGRHLAYRSSKYPATVFIFGMTAMSIMAILHHQKAVKGMTWSPSFSHLSICTSSCVVFLWTPMGCCTVNIPLDIHPKLFRWSPNGKSMLITDKEGDVCIWRLK